MRRQYLKMHRKEVQIDTKYIGVHIPQYLFSYISLCAVSRGISKSAILVEILKNQFDLNLKDEDKVLAKTADTIFKKLQSDNLFRSVQNNYRAFELQLREELHRTGIKQDHIEKIVKLIKEKWNARKKNYQFN